MAHRCRERAPSTSSPCPAHVGVDAESGLVHTAGVTTGKVHDAKVMDRLIREDDEAVYGDKAYASEAKKRFRLRAGVRVQRHRDDKRGPALRSF